MSLFIQLYVNSSVKLHYGYSSTLKNACINIEVSTDMGGLRCKFLEETTNDNFSFLLLRDLRTMRIRSTDKNCVGLEES